MGEVYRARDTRLGREVALKRVSDPALASDIARRRILREARAAGALSHPGIATIYDVLDAPEGLFIVMELVPGETLADTLTGGPLPPDEALEVCAQLADALAHAHARGVVHRDLKPSNIHLTPQGRAKILDFGIAKSDVDERDGGMRADDLGTAEGRMVGSPGYMAPEQVVGRASDQRTDIYSVGIVLFEMLTGERPYAKADRLATTLAMLEGPVPRVDERAPEVPREIADLVARAMARDPEDRFPTASALSVAIARARRSLSDTETFTGTLPDLDQKRGARRSRAALIAAIAALLLIAATALLWKPLRSTPVPARSPVIGVIPLRNRGDAADDALVAGLSDALVKRLGSVRTLRVLPLSETREAAVGARNAAAIAHAVGAEFVVEGSLTRSGSSVDVDLAIVGANGQRWSAGRYTGDAAQVFQLHRRAAEAVTAALTQAGALRGGMTPEPTPPTSNQEAFANYAQARVFLDRPDVPGNLNHAIDLLQSAIKDDPRFALAYAALGEAYMAQYRETKNTEWPPKAQTANLEALRIDPQQPEVRMSLALMYEETGRPDEATEELKQVMLMQPRNDSAHLVLARLLMNKGKWDDSAAEARTAIDLRPAYWRNHAQLGDTYWRAGRLQEAAAAYQRLVELQPDSTRGYQRLGTALQTMGRYDEALDNYLKAVAIRPTAGTLSNMGTLYYWRGDYAKAADAYQRAIQLVPNNPKYYVNLADAQIHLGRRPQAMGNYRHALQEANKLLAVNAQDTDILTSLALSQAKLGDVTAAQATVLKALTVNAQDGDLLFVRAQIEAIAGKNDAACDGVRDALAHGKNAEDIRHADEFRGLKGCAAYDRVAAR
jgi:serine/threonine-protein kinase